MSEKQSSKERIKEITAGIEKGIMELFESDRYRNYLTTIAERPVKEQAAPIVIIAAAAAYQLSHLLQLLVIHPGQISHCQTPA